MSGNLKFPAMISKLVLVEPEGEQRYCRHRQLELHPDVRLLLCLQCQLWIDPFEFLVGYSGEAMILETRIHAMRKEQTKLSQSLTELQRDERKIKSRIRIARKKVRMQVKP